MDELRERLAEEYRASHPRVRLRIPVVDGEALAAVYREGEVLRREEHDSVIDVVARLPLPVLGRLQRRAGILVFESP
jgi:50S ribosomal subunit-associated GTPase HflX